MTKFFLNLLAQSRGSLILQLIAALLFILLLPITLFFDAVVASIRLLWIGRVIRASHIRCPGGHQVELQGAWRCQCGAVFEGAGFEACPSCGSVSSMIICPCGRTIRNPLSRRQT